MKTILILLTMSVLISPSTFAQEIFESSPEQVTLLELFSSEGCSSCPPADKWLASLREQKGLWKNFVPVEFHVDYWNQLGWVDPFSNSSFSQRQRSYAGEWLVPRVYTPGFVLNGEEWRLQSTIKRSGQNSGILKVERKEGQTFLLEFEPEKEIEDQKLNFYVALLGNGLKQKIPAGENEGRTLKHEFVVLHLEKVEVQRTKKGFQVKVELNSKHKARPKSYSIAAWVSPVDRQRPLQAVGGDINYNP